MVRDFIQSFSSSFTSLTRTKNPPTFRVGFKKAPYGIYIRTSATKPKTANNEKAKPTENQALFSVAANLLLKQFTAFGFKTDLVRMDKPWRCFFLLTDIIVGLAILSPGLFLLSSHYLCHTNCTLSRSEFRARAMNACLLLSPVIFYITFRTKWNTMRKIIQIMNCLSLGLKVKDAQQPSDDVKRWARNITIYCIVSIICMLAKVIAGLVTMYGFSTLAIVALFLYSTQLIVFHYLKILVQGLLVIICIFITSKLRSYARMNFRVVSQRQVWQEFHLICSAIKKINYLINFTLFTTMASSIMRIPSLLKSTHHPDHYFDLDFKESVPCIIAFFINIICISTVNREMYNFGRTMWFKPIAEAFPKSISYPSFKWKLAALQEKLDQIMCIICFKIDPCQITVYETPMDIYTIIRLIIVVTTVYFVKPHQSHDELQ